LNGKTVVSVGKFVGRRESPDFDTVGGARLERAIAVAALADAIRLQADREIFHS